MRLSIIQNSTGTVRIMSKGTCVAVMDLPGEEDCLSMARDIVTRHNGFVEASEEWKAKADALEAEKIRLQELSSVPALAEKAQEMGTVTAISAHRALMLMFEAVGIFKEVHAFRIRNAILETEKAELLEEVDQIYQVFLLADATGELGPWFDHRDIQRVQAILKKHTQDTE